MEWAIVLLSIALAGSIYAMYQIHGSQKREIVRLRVIRKLIREEERAMLDFLHVLGKTSEKAVTGTNLHDLIVKGVSEVLKAKGGALYVLDETGQRLVPSSYSQECPPLVKLPERVLLQDKSNPGTVMSYLRLHSISLEEGFLGETYRAEKPHVTENLLPDEGQKLLLKEIAAMATPLKHQGKKIGLLVVANDRSGRRFSKNDFAIFRAVAEQSASALGSLIMRKDAETKRRLEEDLRNASEIQRVLLPTKSPDIRGYEVVGINIPARLVSGDYFDYLPMAHDSLGVVIGDVSGKGIPASLLMAMCRTVLRVVSADLESPKAALSVANRLLYPDIREDKFISLAMLQLKPNSHHITFTRAGHDAPLYFTAATKDVTRLETPGLAFGIDKGDVFDRVVKDQQIEMADGDCILFYTDGVNEAVDRQGREFGMARMQKLFKQFAGQGAKAIIDGLIDALKTFMGDYQQYDDITLVAIRRTPVESPSPQLVEPT